MQKFATKKGFRHKNNHYYEYGDTYELSSSQLTDLKTLYLRNLEC